MNKNPSSAAPSGTPLIERCRYMATHPNARGQIADVLEEAAAELSALSQQQELRENMADIGETFLEKLKRADPEYCWNNCPTEWVVDQINKYDELSQQLKEAQEKLAKGNLNSTADLGNHPRIEGTR